MRTLGEVERAIVAHLQEDGRIPFAFVAADLGVSEATVRRTVQRLVKEDLIVITAVANPQLLGLEAMAWTGIRLKWPDAADFPSRLLEIRGIDYVVTTTGRFQVMAEVAARDLRDLNERVGLIRALPGVTDTETFVHLEIVHQEFQWPTSATRPSHRRLYDVSGSELSEVDRTLLMALRRDGRRSFRQIARETGVSEHQVRSAYSRLNDRGVVHVMAVVNPGRVGLDAMAWIGIRVHAGHPVRETAVAVAEGSHTDYVVVCTGRYDIFAEIACADRADLANSLEREIGAVPGVAEIEVFGVLRLYYKDESVWSFGRVSALED